LRPACPPPGCRPSRTRRATMRRSGRRAAPWRPAARRAASARDVRVVVHRAEHGAPRVAVAGERSVPVDAVRVVGAAVVETAHVAAAAAVPGTVDPGAKMAFASGPPADLGARGDRKSVV